MTVINTNIAETVDITANGTYNVAKYTTANVNVVATKGENHIIVIDYDGTILKEDYLDEGSTFTLPEPPTHERLIFDGWNSPVTITNNQITVGNSDIVIGPMFKTVSGLSEFDITVNEGTGLTARCAITGTKDWGDGTSDSQITHTYASPGTYTITSDATSLPYACFREENDYSPSAYKLRHARIGEHVTQINMTFQNVYSLETITFPNQSIWFNSNTFSSCQSLKAIVFPTNINTLNSNQYQGCRSCASAKYIVLPNNLTKIDYGFMENCKSLRALTIPSSVTYIDYQVLNNISIEKIVLPNVTTLGSSNLRDCANLRTVIINGTNISISSTCLTGCPIEYISILNGASISNQSIMTLATLKKFVYRGSLAIINRESICYSSSPAEYDFSGITNVPYIDSGGFSDNSVQSKIKVPAALYNDFITDECWSQYAYQIEAV